MSDTSDNPYLEHVIRANSWIDRNDDLARRTREHGWRVVGSVMRVSRQSKKLSIRKLASEMGISTVFLSDMELGRRRYTIEWAKKAFTAMSAVEVKS